MSNLAAERDVLAAKLIAAGVERVTLTRTEDVPFVFVGLPTGVAANGIGSWRCEYPITAVYSPPGDTNAVTWALTQVELILTALGFAAFRPVPWGAEQSPAYQLTYPRDVAHPNC